MIWTRGKGIVVRQSRRDGRSYVSGLAGGPAGQPQSAESVYSGAATLVIFHGSTLAR